MTTPEQVLACPMDPARNDADAATIGEYLTKLLGVLWEQEDGFSGKRPFGNSGWQYDVYTALVKAELIDGVLDDDDRLEESDDIQGDRLIQLAIASLTNPSAPVLAEPVEPARPEFDVAVVVFCRATGVDERDAASGAEIAIRHALSGGKRPTLPQEIFLPQGFQDRGFTDPVVVAGVMELGMAAGNGYTWMRVTTKAYRDIGMEKPRD